MFTEAQVSKIEFYLARYGNLRLAITAMRSDERAEIESAAFKARVAAVVERAALEDFYRVLPFCTMVIGFVAGWLN